MQIQLTSAHTQLLLSDEPWNRGIQQLNIIDEAQDNSQLDFLLPALSGHHFFTGVWPPPANAVDYEPHESHATLLCLRHDDGLAGSRRPPRDVR